MTISIQQSQVIHLLEGHAKQQDDEFQTLERKAQQVLSVSSLVTGFVAALNLQSQAADPSLQWPLLVIIGLYLTTFIVGMTALFPGKWAGLPLKPTWEEADRVLQKDSADFVDWLIACYTENIATNQEVLNDKAFRVRLAMILLAADVTMILVSALSLGLRAANGG